MRRRPLRDPLGTPPEGLKAGPQQATQIGDAIEPWLVSGGFVYHPLYGEGFSTGPAGVQLVTYCYVPTGKIGFLKQLRVAPYLSSKYVDPFVSSGVANGAASWTAHDTFDYPGRPGPINGVWETPMGWEGFFNGDVFPGTTPPQWTWSLRLVQGDVDKLRTNRQNIPAFSLADPQSWYLLPSIPVPSIAYPVGIPGVAPGPRWADQRYQVTPKDPLTCHLQIPQNTTLCLFTRWTQTLTQPQGYDENGVINYASEDFPIGPSCGQMLGYMQAMDSTANPAAAVINARHGWGG